MTRNGVSHETTTLAEYLFTRLRQLGIRSVFGVPGDYNLRLLDFIDPTGLNWVGNCNELNAAYASDGYAKINGLSALITTFGVGELSAINGLAGAFAEKAPVIHVVGTPPRDLQDTRALMHHTLADGDYRHFSTMASRVTTTQVNLTDSRTAPERIDWALKQALVQSRPVYIEVPDDIVDVKVSATGLETKLTIAPALEGRQEEALLDEVLMRMSHAQRPLILVDGESRQMRILDQVDRLIKKTEWPTWTTVFGKGLVNEQLPSVYGVYAGALGDPEWKAYFDSADLILNFGPHYTDTNTLRFTTIPRESETITFAEAGTVQIGSDLYRDISDKFMHRLLDGVERSSYSKVTGPPKANPVVDVSKTDSLKQKDFWHFVNPLLREGDIVLTETGTAAYGGREFKLPPNTRLFGAITWLSIGYMLPATLGAGIAQRELKGSSDGDARTVLFIGDGSLQMSVQEISTIIREKLNVIMFVINNEGYTIERAIHGRKKAYNDIAAWRHEQILSFFGADEEHAAKNFFTARTYGELETVMNAKEIQSGKGLRVVEVFTGREDCEGALKALLQQQLKREKPEDA